MNNQKAASVAEQIDRIMQKTALGVFLVAVAYAVSVFEFFVSENVADGLNYLSKVLAIIIIVLVLPGFLKAVSLRRRYGKACREPEGFVIAMFNKAAGKAFQFTFIFLIALEIVNGDALAHLPGEFFIKLIISVTLAIFSLIFFFLSRPGVDEEVDDEFDTGEST